MVVNVEIVLAIVISSSITLEIRIIARIFIVAATTVIVTMMILINIVGNVISLLSPFRFDSQELTKLQRIRTTSGPLLLRIIVIRSRVGRVRTLGIKL